MLAELKRYHRAAEQAWEALKRMGDEPELVASGRQSLDATLAIIAKAEGKA